MTDERWRCFVAITLDETLRSRLALKLSALRGPTELDSIRWSNTVDWHVTLAFIGDIEPAQVSSITSALARVAAVNDALWLRVGGLGGFPTAASARVVYYAVERSAALEALARDLRAAVGVGRNDPFRPHVTVGRVRRGRVDLRAWIAAADPADATFKVERVAFIRSYVGNGPPRHATFASFGLGVRGGV